MALTNNVFKRFYEEPKVIEDDISWKSEGSGRFVIKDVNIVSNVLHNEDIRLYCTQNIFNNFAFIIVYYGEEKIVLVKYDKKIHPPDFIDKCSGNSITEPHKHYFKENCPGGIRKVIPSHEIDRNDVNRAFMQFLDECNIRLLGEYEKLSIIRQTSLMQFYSEELK